MLSTGIPELKSADDISYLRDAFSLDRTNEEAAENSLLSFMKSGNRNYSIEQLHQHINKIIIVKKRCFFGKFFISK